MELKEHGKNSEDSRLLEIQLIRSATELSSMDLSRPFLAKNMSKADSLTIQSLLNPPLSQLETDYFTDARRKNTVPDATGRVGDVVSRIIAGGPEKIGTQMILIVFPEILQRFLEVNSWLSSVFGVDRVNTWREMGVSVTVPVFISRGKAIDQSHNTLQNTTRTDLHCEPISNLVGQTVGEKNGPLWNQNIPTFYVQLSPRMDGRIFTRV